MHVAEFYVGHNYSLTTVFPTVEFLMLNAVYKAAVLQSFSLSLRQMCSLGFSGTCSRSPGAPGSERGSPAPSRHQSRASETTVPDGYSQNIMMNRNCVLVSEWLTGYQSLSLQSNC